MSESSETGFNGRNGLAERSVLFAVAFVFWLLLVWPLAPAEGNLLVGDVAIGLAVAAVAALVMRNLVTHRFARLLEPARYFWAVVYLVVLGYYVFMANLDVMYRVLHPRMPIRPGIVKAKTTLCSASARTALANSITLTPGTLTMEVSGDGTFYIHWITVVGDPADETIQRIVERFQWFIRRILE